MKPVLTRRAVSFPFRSLSGVPPYGGRLKGRVVHRKPPCGGFLYRPYYSYGRGLFQGDVSDLRNRGATITESVPVSLQSVSVVCYDWGISLIGQSERIGKLVPVRQKAK